MPNVSGRADADHQQPALPVVWQQMRLIGRRAGDTTQTRRHRRRRRSLNIKPPVVATYRSGDVVATTSTWQLADEVSMASRPPPLRVC